MKKSSPQLLIFDFDGCLYPFPENFIEVFLKGMGHTGYEISAGTWPHETATKKIRDSFRKHGFAFKEAANEFGITMGEANLIHHRNTIFDLQRDDELIDAFKGLNRALVFPMILTQGSRCNLDRHLPKIGIENEIARNMRISVDEHGYERLKSNSEYPWLYAKWRAQHVTGLTFDDAHIHVFEDSVKNLEIPHNMGWNTVFVHHGKPLPDRPIHIHRQAKTIAEILREFPQRAPRHANNLTHAQDLG